MSEGSAIGVSRRMTPDARNRKLFTSASAAARQERAARWLQALPPGAQALVVGFSQIAAAEVTRGAGRDATFGWHRLSLDGVAAAVASSVLAARRLVPVGELAIEAVCARVVHSCGRAELGRLEALAGHPGLSRALSRTLQDIRLAGIEPAALAPLRPELATLLRLYEAELARARLADRATVLRLATDRIDDGIEQPVLGHPTLFADLSVQSAAERDLVAALARRSSDVLALGPAADSRSTRHLADALDAKPEEIPPQGFPGSLQRLQRQLFSPAAPVQGSLGDDVAVFSAPGEGRECVEIARRILQEAARGVRFDRMAILLRAPLPYRPLLEEALRRAGIPPWFARGVLQPDPAGRAFLSLLACAAEGLSAASVHLHCVGPRLLRALPAGGDAPPARAAPCLSSPRVPRPPPANPPPRAPPPAGGGGGRPAEASAPVQREGGACDPRPVL